MATEALTSSFLFPAVEFSLKNEMASGLIDIYSSHETTKNRKFTLYILKKNVSLLP